jgi:hypothetical protein
MKAYGEWRYWSTVYDLDTRCAVSGHLHVPAALTPEKSYSTNYMGGWSGPIVGLDTAGNWTPAIEPVVIPTEL